MIKKIFLLLFMISGLLACSSTSILVKPPGAGLPVKVLYEPLSSSTPLAREVMEQLDRASISALRNRGYLVIEATASTAEYAKLPRVGVMINKFERTSLLAAHINRIGGKLLFRDANGAVLAESERLEVERGGLIFNSGQIFKGLSEQYNNESSDNVAGWMARFSTKLADSLPIAQQGGLVVADLQPRIEAVSLSSSNKGPQICASGTAGVRAVLEVEDLKLPLTEVGDSGKYCQNLPPYVSNFEDVPTVVFTNFYGFRDKQAVALSTDSLSGQNASKCGNEDIVVSNPAGQIEIQVLCAGQPCTAKSACGRSVYRAYRLLMPVGHELIAEFKAPGFKGNLQGSQIVQANLIQIYRRGLGDPLQRAVDFKFQDQTGSKPAGQVRR